MPRLTGSSGWFSHSFTAAAYQSITMDWHTWDPRPVAGDLLIVISTESLVGVPPGWILATANAAYVTYRPDLPAPVFTSTAPDGGETWYLKGFIVYPDDTVGQSWLTSPTS